MNYLPMAMKHPTNIAYRTAARVYTYRYQHEKSIDYGMRAIDLGVELVIPCHFGTFRLSLDAPSSALPRFAAAARESGVSWWMPQLLTAADAGGVSGRNASLRHPSGRPVFEAAR